jgi:hypothetical protein
VLQNVSYDDFLAPHDFANLVSAPTERHFGRAHLQMPQSILRYHSGGCWVQRRAVEMAPQFVELRFQAGDNGAAALPNG